VETVWRVMAMDPVRRVWTLRKECETEAKARAEADDLHDNDRLRVRIIPHQQRPLSIKPAVYNSARTWREEQLARQVELADAKKRYKSPG